MGMGRKKRPRNAKLYEDQVRNIRDSYLEGFTVTELEGYYGVTSMAISNIVHNKTWKGVV